MIRQEHKCRLLLTAKQAWIQLNCTDEAVGAVVVALREAIIKKKFCFYGHFPYGGGGLNPIP